MKPSSNLPRPAGASISTTTSSAYFPSQAVSRSSRPQPTATAASSPLSATGCRTSHTTKPQRHKNSFNVLKGEAFAGEYEPVTVALVPLRDLGQDLGERE